MGKHTPGPWGYWPNCCRDGGMVTADKYGGHVAAPTVYPKHPEATKANAQLIAAAPDLLEALVDLVDAEWMVSNDWGGDRDTVYEKAKAAIAKAKAQL